MKKMNWSLSALALLVFGTVASAGPNVTISKSCPGLRYLGRDATFDITVTNTGDAAANNVVVTDMIPVGISFTGADNGGVREGQRVVWRVGTLEAGKSMTLKSTFLCNTIGSFENEAMVTYCAEAKAQCSIDVKGIPAILLECVDNPDPIEVNGNLTYTITVTNQGSAVGTNIVIKCMLPAEEEHVSSTGPTAVTADGKSISFAPLATLAPKASAVYKVNVKGVGEGDVRFKVELTSDQMDSPVNETESTHIYQ
ncbi:MAG TPA: hypothetical protein PKN33_10295 [Phycisphaerae bacterium]|nr:DUF11 domain-containing protein [Phycisphaerales bacterium]HNO78437.1 hypothetical protein [Phycisphaerae bacterium]